MLRCAWLLEGLFWRNEAILYMHCLYILFHIFTVKMWRADKSLDRNNRPMDWFVKCLCIMFVKSVNFWWKTKLVSNNGFYDSCEPRLSRIIGTACQIALRVVRISIWKSENVKDDKWNLRRDFLKLNSKLYLNYSYTVELTPSRIFLFWADQAFELLLQLSNVKICK